MKTFEAWYSDQHSAVYAVCAALCGDPDLAAEATDEAFVRAFERWDRVSGMATPGGWVQVVAANHVRRLVRRRRRERRWVERQRPVDATRLPVSNGPLWEAVRDLPVRQRTALVLRYVGDLAESDIASAMNVSRGTVSSTLHDAVHALRSTLGDLDWELTHE